MPPAANYRRRWKAMRVRSFNGMFSPDGQRVVTANYDGTACVWDAAGGQVLAKLGVLKRFRDCGEFRAPSLGGFVGLPVKDTGAYPCRIPSIRLCWTFGSKTVMLFSVLASEGATTPCVWERRYGPGVPAAPSPKWAARGELNAKSRVLLAAGVLQRFRGIAGSLGRRPLEALLVSP